MYPSLKNPAACQSDGPAEQSAVRSAGTSGSGRPFQALDTFPKIPVQEGRGGRSGAA